MKQAKSKLLLTASIVLYKHDFKTVERAIRSFLSVPVTKKLYLINNDPSVEMEKFTHPEVDYISNDRNLGFAKGHNSILNKIMDQSYYHLVLNPDVYFDSEILEHLVDTMNKDEELALIAPKVNYFDGSPQLSCRRYPTLIGLASRRSPFVRRLFFKRYQRETYQDQDLKQAFSPDWVHGCFMLFRTSDFVEMKGFDERYFLYMEDVDICRKIDGLNKRKRYEAQVEIFHELNRESVRNLTAFRHHIISIFQYFYKWGIKL